MSILDATDVRDRDGGSAMDMMERRVREVFATLLSKGAKALERTATELERASAQLREDRERKRAEAEQVWSEGPPRREPDTMIRSAPLRAVPDTPTDGSDTAVDGSDTPAGDRSGTAAGDRSGTAAGDRVTDVTDTAAGEAGTGTPWTPPAEPPETLEPGAPGDVDAAATTSSTVAGTPRVQRGADAPTDRLQALAAGTVTQIRPQLGDLSPDELRRLREIEVANRNRRTLIAAIDRTLAEVE